VLVSPYGPSNTYCAMTMLIGTPLLLYKRIAANIKLLTVPDVPETPVVTGLHKLYVLFVNGDYLFVPYGTVYHRILFKYNHTLMLCQYYA